MVVSKKIVIHFPKRLSDQPIISRLVKQFDLDFNSLKASINPDQEGLLILELTGKQSEYDKGMEFLLKTGVEIQSLSQDVTRNEERCTSCGACITVCPASAFVLDRKNRLVAFDNEKCVACELCIKACPPRAMEVHF